MSAQPQPLAQPHEEMMLGSTRPDRRLLLLALLLVALVGGVGIARLLRSSFPAEGSPEVTFARAMALHHEQAVEMAIILRDRAADEDLRTFALDIILTQQAQIGQMDGWLSVWKRPIGGSTAPASGHQHGSMGMATEAQLAELRTLPVPEAEIAFLKLMIPHHQAAVAMARDVLATTRRPEVARLATSIVQSQESEIRYMQELLKQRGA